ncbi:hypothetical protein HYS47_03260 [Candidatus Woesearchaeota archaeon]|nr:hypothetical protein [Candidatus Woesearchaeota archaeon]
MRTQSNLRNITQYGFNPQQKATIHANVKQAIASELGIPEEQVTSELIMAAFTGNRQPPKSHGLTPDQQFRLQLLQDGNVLPHPASIASEDGVIVAFGDNITAIQEAMSKTYGDRQSLGLTTITATKERKDATFVSAVDGLPHLEVVTTDLANGKKKPVTRNVATNGSQNAMRELLTQVIGMSGGYYRDAKLGKFDVRPFAAFNNVGELTSIEVYVPYNPLSWMANDCGIDQSCVVLLNGNTGTIATVQSCLEGLGFKVPHATTKSPTPFTDYLTPSGFQPTDSDGTPVKMDKYGRYEKFLFAVKAELTKDQNKATIQFGKENHGYVGVAIYLLGQWISPRYLRKQQQAFASLVQWIHLAISPFKQEIVEEICQALGFEQNEIEQDGTVRFLRNVALNSFNIGIMKVNVTDPKTYVRRVASQIAEQLEDQAALRNAFGQIVAIRGIPVEQFQLAAGFEFEDAQHAPQNA